MKQIVRIALLSLTLFGFLVLGNHTVRAENQSDSEPKVQRSTKKKPQLRRATVKKQKKKSEKKRVRNTRRITNLRKTWARNRAKQTRQDQRTSVPAETRVRQPADPAATLQPQDAVRLGLQSPESVLPQPFYVDIQSDGDRHRLDVGVQTEDGSALSFHVAEEASTEGITKSVGVGGSVTFDEMPGFITRTRDILFYVPKKIGAGVVYFGRGVKRLFSW
ncbi:MAG: hypothetical protein OXH39_23970 [Candidatus Poribacteria bacterium]|nr:hypothetical protein [Candidatus Poribacteria bacterium]